MGICSLHFVTFTMTVNTHAVKPRVQRFRPFFGVSEEDGNGSIAAGFVTYDTNDAGEETYQLTKVELGVRSDHVCDAVAQLQGNDVPERLVSDAGRNEGFVGSVQENEKARASQEEADARQRKADEAAVA